MQQKVQFYTVTEDEHGQRLDNFLMRRLKGVPKSALYRIVRKGEVRINKGRVKPDRRLQKGDIVRVPPVRVSDEKKQLTPSANLSSLLIDAVIHDQNGLVVVNKPSGLAVHGGSGINLGMVEALRQLPQFKGFLELIHRLDRDTSGCVMLARKRSVLKRVQDQLRERKGIQKTYIALVQGVWPKHCKEVDVPLLRSLMPNNERVVKVSKDGKSSVTRFKVLEAFSDVTLVEAMPITGRTHQIRVHAKHMGCPLVGDAKYGDTPLNNALAKLGSKRLFLHASELKVRQEEGEMLHFQAPLPSELSALLKRLK